MTELDGAANDADEFHEGTRSLSHLRRLRVLCSLPLEERLP